MIMVILGIVLIALLLGFLSICSAAKHAPEGREDESGFHKGDTTRLSGL